MEASATTAKKCMEIKKFREISPLQFVEERMCNRFMLNSCINKDTVQKLKWIPRISCLLFTMFCEQFSVQKI